MKEIIATITSKGQVTLPVEVRASLGLKKGDKIAFVIEPEGGVRLQVPLYPSIASLRGAAGTLPRPMSWDDIKQVVQQERAEEMRHKLEQPTS